jgi:hypothetical protein
MLPGHDLDTIVPDRGPGRNIQRRFPGVAQFTIVGLDLGPYAEAPGRRFEPAFAVVFRINGAAKISGR